jgi:hypothetical protein
MKREDRRWAPALSARRRALNAPCGSRSERVGPGWSGWRGPHEPKGDYADCSLSVRGANRLGQHVPASTMMAPP